MMNNLNISTLNDDSPQINNLIMKTFTQLFFGNNEFIINSGLLNIWTSPLARF